MLNINDKVIFLYNLLSRKSENYADSFKTDILLLIGDFTYSNPILKFLNELNSFEDIEKWVNKLTSRIVMDEDYENTNEIIYDYILLG